MRLYTLTLHRNAPFRKTYEQKIEGRRKIRIMKYAVRYLKNTFYPLEVPETLKLEDGQMVLVRTEKGEEALKVFIVNSQISKLWENSKSKPEPFHVIRTLSQRDIQTLEEIKQEEVQSFFKCQALVHSIN